MLSFLQSYGRHLSITTSIYLEKRQLNSVLPTTLRSFPHQREAKCSTSWDEPTQRLWQIVYSNTQMPHYPPLLWLASYSGESRWARAAAPARRHAAESSAMPRFRLCLYLGLMRIVGCSRTDLARDFQHARVQSRES